MTVTAWLIGELGFNLLMINGRAFSVRDSGFADDLK